MLSRGIAAVLDCSPAMVSERKVLWWRRLVRG
jgi:hypothetical protein